MNGTSDMADGAIDANGGLVFKLNAVAPECDGTIWVSNDDLGVFEGFRFLVQPARVNVSRSPFHSAPYLSVLPTEPPGAPSLYDRHASCPGQS